MNQKEHWENVYRSKPDTEVSWYQAEPHISLQLILEATGGRGRVIDIGGGSSVLIDRLLERPFDRLAVLDIAEFALDRARSRLGARAQRVEWIVADITEVNAIGEFDVWHDRAVFHFLTDAEDRRKYLSLVRRTLQIDGHLILATFAPEGPRRCNNLDVCRYDATALVAVVGQDFELVREMRETHRTPSGFAQEFQYVVLRRLR